MMFEAARERRRSLRLRPVRAKALCSIHTDEGAERAAALGRARHHAVLVAGVYRVRDLSRGGALLEGAPAVQPGTRVSVRVLLPETDPLQLSGRVVRLSAGRYRETQVAIGFSSVSPDDEDRIADWVAREWCAARRVMCVVAASSLTVRMELARRLKELGASVTRARMPIELIQRLERSREETIVVFLGESLGGCTADEIATFLQAAYPAVRRVSVTASADLAGAGERPWMHGRVEPPWDPDALLQQLVGASRPPEGGRGMAGVG